MTKANLSRKKREKLQHKEEILATALKLFSDKGFHNVSMQQVAEESEEKVGEKQKVVNYIKAHRQIIEDNAPSIRLYLSKNLPSALTLRPDVEPETDRVREVVRQKLTDIFKSGMRKGVFKSLDPWTTTLSLSAILESFVFSAIKSPGEISIEDGISRIEKLFFEGILKL